MAKTISLRGCRLHNLKNVNVDIPLGQVTVVCGPSGCGKSSLILDTLHGESKRRYLETLSPFASELLGGKRNIPIDSAEGLPASIAIGPTHGESPARSYAISIAECDSGLRTLFASFAKPACPLCGSPMESSSREEIIRNIAALNIGTKLQFFAPIETGGHSLDKLSALFLAQGFTRAFADGNSYSLPDLTPSEKLVKPKEFFIVTDRIIIRENTRTRIAEAVDATLKLTHSTIVLDISGTRKVFSTEPRCKNAGRADHKDCESTAIPVLDARSFSPYNRICACSHCLGTGILESDESPRNPTGICPGCNGNRLKKPYLNATIDGISYEQVLSTRFENLPELLHRLFNTRIQDNLRPTFNALEDRLQAIKDLGLGYLTAGRSGSTLSGGELQRLKLSSLSTGHLNNLLIALDEPASGLHANDVKHLWKVLQKIRERGNTLVLIEHNPLIIKQADYIVEMGPGAGEKGGEILFQGTREKVLGNPQSPTGCWIRSLDEMGMRPVPSLPLGSEVSESLLLDENRGHNRSEVSPGIEVKDFSLFDMQKVNAHFPIGKFSVITGQSGSGKSTLLFQNIEPRAKSGEFQPLGIEALSILTTGDFHGNRRSTVASAIDIMTKLRDLFAKLPESKVRGYSAAKFSTTSPGGRCENCKGEGVIYDPSGFSESECPVCLGKRFRDEVLEVRFKTYSIADILDMEIGEAFKLLENLKPFAEKLKPLMDTGLEYLRLGQVTAHLSGGERARLRLSIALARAKAPHTLFLFDEPARGLHQKDIQLLLNLIHGLCKAGHTVIAIEHAQDFVNAADYSIELNRA